MGEYIDVVQAAVGDGARRAYRTYWQRIRDAWGTRGLDEPTPSEIKSLMHQARAVAVSRCNAPAHRNACRRGDALALRRRDLDPHHSLIELHKKGNTFRQQPVSPTLVRALTAHADERGARRPDDQVLRYVASGAMSCRRSLFSPSWVCSNEAVVPSGVVGRRRVERDRINDRQDRQSAGAALPASTAGMCQARAASVQPGLDSGVGKDQTSQFADVVTVDHDSKRWLTTKKWTNSTERRNAAL
jgi:integrase